MPMAALRPVASQHFWRQRQPPSALSSAAVWQFLLQRSASGMPAEARPDTDDAVTQQRRLPWKQGQGQKRRSVKSVAALHIENCEALARSPPRGGAAVVEALWQRASIRMCKLAQDMDSRDLAHSAWVLAAAGQRDMRALFVLSEAAISKR